MASLIVWKNDKVFKPPNCSVALTHGPWPKISWIVRPPRRIAAGILDLCTVICGVNDGKPFLTSGDKFHSSLSPFVPIYVKTLYCLAEV